MPCTNCPIGYANPDAVTQIGNGLSTTSYAYDNNGNLTSSGNGTATTSYTYDYANRLIGLFANGATTTYGYDAFGQRVFQITATTSTSTYPFKFYSVASTTRSSTNYATTTDKLRGKHEYDRHRSGRQHHDELRFNDFTYPMTPEQLAELRTESPLSYGRPA
jgi:YD repeat-containing protein